ncbi:MBL fold metallo-hydrolase [Mycolicibacterium moriokaense]|uniref:Glyoxylase-like metal-dependent hydrolase (Beta-lactamase superfamily II) n=1 Tax=Mycolicibacterium moriokaense TaxID=39691 RepID=A0A318HGA1_9MYCO|nr:MBL fold metallo-hydrolase [Mycolicibacterium moriokaense]PXW98869.1 glyoxylase-like metal-dependent hydrolase (beta-lactamase superfamily II) [Mycolicibacterium moriokaense]
MAAGVDLVPLVDDGLGNSAYLVDLGDGRALVVDVSRDLRAVHEAAAKRGLTVAFAADTHLHADFLSGAHQLAATAGAKVLASAAGHREFAHTGLHDGDEVDLGGLRLRALLTPGHTHEHVAFLLLDGAREVGVFTGGSLIVGSAARTDLVSQDRTDELTRAQYRSLHRLAALPADVQVWPTHGAGSFCSAPPGTERTSTIARELATNPLLQATDENAFVTQLLGSLGSHPPYFRRLGEINRLGPPLLDGAPKLASLGVDEVWTRLADGAVLIDARPVDRFAAAHVRGAISIPLRPVFASWLGWLAPTDRPLIIVADADQDSSDIAWQAAKIGYENIVGELDGAMAAWTAAGHDTASIPLTRAGRIDGRRVLDIRQRSEYLDGHLPGAMHVELGDIAHRAAEVPDEPTVVMCGHGERAMGAASLLEAAGHHDLVVLAGGPPDWAAATGGDLQIGA